MPSKRIFSTEEIDRALEMRRCGQELIAICTFLRCSKPTVLRLFREHGVPVKTCRRSEGVFVASSKSSQANRFRALLLYRFEGYSLARLASYFRCREGRVRATLCSLGVVSFRRASFGVFESHSELVANIILQRQSGVRIKDIARSVGICAGKVVTILLASNMRSDVRAGTTSLGLSSLVTYRLLAMERLGGQCVRCGESRYEVLQINHLGGNNVPVSASGRPGIRDRQIADWQFRQIAQGKIREGFEVRCANCNSLYEYERGNRRPLPADVKSRLRALLITIDTDDRIKKNISQATLTKRGLSVHKLLSEGVRSTRSLRMLKT